jgi:hypothetical protein
MCFNAPVSMATFLLSLVFFLSLLSRGILQKDNIDIYMGIITLLIGSMQLIEYFLWKNQTCNKTNHSLSIMLFILLYLQPIITVIAMTTLFKFKTSNWIYFSILLASCVVFTLLMIFNVILLNQKRLCSLPACQKDCRLQWAPLSSQSLLMKLFLMFYFIIFILVYIHDYQAGFMSKYPLRYAVLPVTLLIAVIYALVVSSKNVFGSVWCFLALLFGPIALLRI